MGERVGCVGGASVLVRQVEQPHFDAFCHDFAQFGCFVHAFGEILVAVDDHALIPLADTRCIGFRVVYLTLRIQGDEGVWIVHDRGAVVIAGSEVVR